MLRYLPSEELLYGRIVHNGYQNIHFTWFAYTTPFLVICDISAWKAIGIQYGVSNEIWLESSLRTAVIDEIRYLELTWFASVGHCSRLLAYANNFFLCALRIKANTAVYLFFLPNCTRFIVCFYNSSNQSSMGLSSNMRCLRQSSRLHWLYPI